MTSPSGFRPAARPRGATIRDVAARADVSVATVSRVFNDAAQVREPTARRVLDAASLLRYVPHIGARSLSTRSTATIGVLLPDLHGEFFSEVIRGIDSAARLQGYHLLVSGSHSDWKEMAAVIAATRGRVDGVIVMSPELEADQALQAHLPHGLPVVLLNCPNAGGPSITIDNRRGTNAAMRHLASLGHRRIGFIRGPERNADALERLHAYRSSMARLGERTARFEVPGNFIEESGYSAGRRLLQLNPRPTALFAANDAMAIGAMCAFREAGVSVPTEMAVVGFDDIPIARYVTPPLTTVTVEIAALGRRALEMLLQVLNSGQGRERHESIPTRLVIRESCGAKEPAISQTMERTKTSIHRRAVR